MKNIVLPVSGIILAGLLVACSPAQESSLTTAENTPEAQFNPETMSEEQFKALGLELRRMVGTPTASSPDQCGQAMGRPAVARALFVYSTQVLNGDKEAEFLKNCSYNQLSNNLVIMPAWCRTVRCCRSRRCGSEWFVCRLKAECKHAC